LAWAEALHRIQYHCKEIEMTVAQHETVAPPEHLLKIQSAPKALYVLRTALELGLFELLAKGAKTARAVADELNLNARASEALLNVLLALGFVSREETQYRLSPESAAYLVQSSDLFMGMYLQITKKMEDSWAQLTDVVRSGQPLAQVNTQAGAEEFFPALAESIFPMSFATAKMVAKDLSAVNQGQIHILDVAAGSGVWTIPLAQANKSAKVDALDFPAVLKVTEKITAKCKVADQYSYLCGDWRTVAWKDDWYDIIVLGHILHSEGLNESRKLLARCHQSLKSGGKIVVAEFLCNDLRDGPPAAVLFELNMFLHTTDGCVFTLSQLTELMQECGFKSIAHSAIIDEKPILIGTK
jgi:ubiquinone/menaquinone biosynthesis C-methylase UbiE/predicted transcriptional regulator